MLKTNKKRTALALLVAALLLIAWLCRIQRAGNVRGWVRCIIQCGLLFAWGVGVQRRIISKKVRAYLLTIVALYIFWLLDRTVKYTLLNGSAVLSRYAWYLYYIPQLLTAVFLLLCAFSLRECEDYKLPKMCRLLFLPNVWGIATVLSNDLHQKVFAFPNGIPNAGDTYSYGILYYVIMAIYFSEIVAFFCILIRKCRISRKNVIVLPLVPVLLLILYGAFYVADYDLLAVPFGDMTAVNCSLAVFSLEACICKGLIPSNTHYEELFLSAMVSAQITDADYNTLLSSTGDEIPVDLKKRRALRP